MNELNISIDKNSYQPREQVQGSIRWQLIKPPKEIFLQIGWQTEGRGTQDNRVEYEQIFITDSHSGTENFYYELPASPYSFSGKLIELNWFIVAYTKKGKVQTSTDIIVAPGRVAVTI
ncbi:MAG: hypothetical protein ACRBBR_14465 [Cellvibrionaceae bacterium]